MKRGHPRPYEISARVRSALRRNERQTAELCARHDLTPEQYTLLLMVKAGPDESSSVSSLASQLYLAHNSVAERVLRAAEAGLVRRERSTGDGRVTIVRLTREGDRRLTAAYLDLGEESDRLIELLAAVRRLDALRRRAASVEAYR